MQGKGIIKFFLIVMAIVCLVQYLFIWPTSRVENQADEYAQQVVSGISDKDVAYEREKEARESYLDSMSSEEIFTIPLLKSYTYEELKGQQLNLGLDLKGGMSVILQVNLQEYVEAMSNYSNDPDLQKALDNATERLTEEQEDYITLFAEEFQKLESGKSLASIFSRNQALSDNINFNSTDAEVIRLLRKRADETVDLTFKRLKDRIDKYGVTQPNVSLDAARDLIIVELPGVENFERARNYLQASAELGFWNVYRASDPGIIAAFQEADKKLAAMMGDSSVIEESSDNVMYDTTRTAILDEDGNETGEFEINIDTLSLDNNAGTASSNGPLFKAFTPNVSTGQGLTMIPSVMGMVDENKKDYVMELLQKPEIKSLFPADIRFLWSRDAAIDYETREETNQYELYAVKQENANGQAPLQGDKVINASSQMDPVTNQINVNLTMDQKGSQIWADMTRKAAQDNQRSIAIVLDNEVVSAPSVNDPITNGRSSISGNFSVQEGQDLANILQIGKLPAKTDIIQESLVGPSLGQENINKSISSLLIGFALVLIFMILYYGAAGIVSILALFANVFFIFGALSSYGTVLTLPGIAGVVLTIGMAVDANVIIYERVREELRSGKSMKIAIQDGFKYSYSAIIDANVTTLIVAIVLAYFGLGPIKGFAIVLIIGVICTLLTAVLFTRLIVDWWINKGKKISFWTGFSKNMFANLTVDWMGKRKIAYAVSGILIVLSVGSILTRGFEFGVDFKGGRSYNVEFASGTDVDVAELRNALTASFEEEEPVVKAVDAINTYNVTTSYQIDDNSDEADAKVIEQLHEGINNVMGGNISFEEFKQPESDGTKITSASKVGPTIADDIIRSSWEATIIALILIFLYIFIRFSKWQFSLGAVSALLHDTLILLGLFSLLHGVLPFSLEIDQAFIAALLTTIGYSINDTVIVFDRIREFMTTYSQRTKKDIINLAINNTFSRTIITSMTTFLVVLILFIFGGSSIKGFSFALLIGILVGTYSSIFIGTPVMAELTSNFSRKAKMEKGKYATPKSTSQFSALFPIIY